MRHGGAAVDEDGVAVLDHLRGSGADGGLAGGMGPLLLGHDVGAIRRARDDVAAEVAEPVRHAGDVPPDRHLGHAEHSRGFPEMEDPGAAEGFRQGVDPAEVSSPRGAAFP